jgi:hypothetical protein
VSTTEQTAGGTSDMLVIVGLEPSLMKFINLYLVGYVVLILGVVLALWKTGVLGRVGGFWISVGVLVAIGIGIMMSVSSGKPNVEIQR